GRAHLRPDLARPVGNRLFFAGEATSTEFFSTAHGAYFSGIRAIAEFRKGHG
ncbi:MAG: FAD-dependent oxidoreductase, partial [Alphaproteobacteria bacterium]